MSADVGRVSPVPEPSEIATIRDLVDALLEQARDLDKGLDTPMELGICDGTDLQLVDTVDLNCWSTVSSSGRGSPGGQFLILRGHIHPGEKAGKILRGAASHADEELREVTGEDGG
jgi:hypothetical protein